MKRSMNSKVSSNLTKVDKVIITIFSIQIILTGFLLFLLK